MLAATTLQFLKQLKQHNSKEWFDLHRNNYTQAKENFTELVTEVLQQFGKKDPSIAMLMAKETMFRINRDVRFSKNKAPYKNNMAFYLVKGGKKSPLAGYYFHCEPGGKSFVGGGLYGGESDQIKKVRQEIDYNWEEFSKLIAHPIFKKSFGDLSFEEGMSLQREPKGYEKENPAIKYIKLKTWIATLPIADEDLTAKDLPKKIAAAFAAMQPLIIFLNRAMEE
ncbi:MAG: DUF2461 domain-containing protein [Sphingobacteriia bacterium]|jgi:uncharacterized protein (TIGR02453 family)|nr:MAG: DUF2461 domain-containing protein [Sphingobacteriia bacterium]TAG29483.1 MAG: DUF2461 domain-containing protein [Sphingobacteriia bacterium]